MIKKAVLLTLSAPFLMVFSFDESSTAYADSWQSVVCTRTDMVDKYIQDNSDDSNAFRKVTSSDAANCSDSLSYTRTAVFIKPIDLLDSGDFLLYDIYNVQFTDEQCQSQNTGSSIPLSPSSANYLTSGGSVSGSGGACAVVGTGSICSEVSGETQCTVTLDSNSTGQISTHSTHGIE